VLLPLVVVTSLVPLLLLLCAVVGCGHVLLLRDWLTRCDAAVRLSVLLACNLSTRWHNLQKKQHHPTKL
jgi:hypothetical protein